MGGIRRMEQKTMGDVEWYEKCVSGFDAPLNIWHHLFFLFTIASSTLLPTSPPQRHPSTRLVCLTAIGRISRVGG